jgi:hypothetical protein
MVRSCISDSVGHDLQAASGAARGQLEQNMSLEYAGVQVQMHGGMIKVGPCS